MIEGVQIKPLKIFRDERGQVMHMMRCDDGVFERFGQIYFSVTNPGVIKAWKKHLRMTQHFAVPRGDIKLVIYDDRAGSSTQGKVQEINVGEKNYQLICIPPQLWYGFCAQGDQPAMIANCSDIPHDPQEVEQVFLGDGRIPYSWV
ncbi:MAG: dTDP-4-dehydrorhamnose 3,5-epimerase family protein [Candidatus Omnitrophica bacterium]|nr:dTDP-4-dehydrorhamnose 3,5-epimerase family protein [Candidatus Omnitrophota bacterium]